VIVIAATNRPTARPGAFAPWQVDRQVSCRSRYPRPRADSAVHMRKVPVAPDVKAEIMRAGRRASRAPTRQPRQRAALFAARNEQAPGDMTISSAPRQDRHGTEAARWSCPRKERRLVDEVGEVAPEKPGVPRAMISALTSGATGTSYVHQQICRGRGYRGSGTTTCRSEPARAQKRRVEHVGTIGCLR